MSEHHWHLPDQVLTIGPRPLVMGIVNVTPDSFSDGGKYATPETAVAHGLELVQQGADLLDIGGESTRPGSLPVPAEDELRRVVPVVEQLAKRTTVPISVDTSKSAVARASLAAGARVINDVTALTGDSDMPAVVRDANAGVILMHMQGSPATMQLEPRYGDVVTEIADYLEKRLQALADFGIAGSRVAVDPGIGFGKTREHNLQILARLHELQRLGRPICLGVSRKGLLDRPVERRVAGGLAVLFHALSRGAVQIIRVHDVEETRDALTMWEAIQRYTV